MLVANARMYAVTPQVRDAWSALFDWVSRYSGIPLVYVDHAAPAPLEALWSRHDLAAAFMCGFPFASAAPKPLILAAPIPSPPRYRRQPIYCTDFVVRADSKYRNVSDTFGLDSYVRDLLERHEPATTAKLRTVESTAMTPIPLLIASPSTPLDTIERLRHALLASSNEPEAAAILDHLLLSGFALVDAADYDRLLSQARETETAGYPVPG
jgi:ABC-type phosphate/phosphonate transport system substrate-binding protein